MKYYGYINIEYGGIYLDFEEFKECGDYCPCVKITNLDFGCGFEGAILIERGSIYIPENEEKRKSALSCIGIEPGESYTDFDLISAFEAYYGVQDGTYGGEVIIQTDKDSPMTFDGWQADKEYSESFWNSGLSLKEWIEQEFI